MRTAAGPGARRTTLRVLLLGEIVEGALYHSYRRGFEAEGCEVSGLCLQRTYEASAPLGGSRVARRLLAAVALRRFNERLPGAAETAAGGRGPDLVVVLKGNLISGETVSEMRRRFGVPVVNFYPDDPFTDSRASRMYCGAETLASYDRCFTFARHLMPAYGRVGATGVHYLPFARDPELHRPPESRIDPEFDVVFVGNIDEERVRWMEALSDFRLGIYGELTRAAVPRGNALRRARFMPAQYGPRFVESVHRGHISLNVMRHQNRLSHNMRSYESPACAAFTLSQRTPELTTLFREGEQVAFFGDRDELREQVRYWLARPAERARVAAAGFRRVEHDTYAVRARTILEVAGLRSSEAA